MRNRNKRKMIIYGLMIALMITTVAYAALQTSLNINGTVTKKGGKWNIYFDNPTVVSKIGEAEITLPDTFPTNTTSFDFDVVVVKPTDSVTFTVDVVNGGTIDAVIDSITLSGITEAASQDVLFKIGYADGTPILEGDLLEKGERKRLSLTVEYDEKSTNLSSEDVVLTLGATIIYLQTVDGQIIKGDNPGIIEGDTSLASVPNLLNNSLVPVVYDENYYGEGMGSWIVADTTTEWYNYSEQQWANAVILESGVTKSVGDPVTVSTVVTGSETIETEVRAMYVWIPRYEYKIEGTYGTHRNGTAGTADLPGEIEVKFISKSQTSADPGYILHPAFTWDNDDNGTIATNEHISGIWVGKFETSFPSGPNTYPVILPNIVAMADVYHDVYTYYLYSQRFSTYLTNSTNIDSHMLKNSEWGAVAYLSQSIYGKYGNSMYTGANKEVYQNRNSGYITGNSNGTPSQYTTNTQCTYDDITDRGGGTGSCGGGASTTGNIYGVYDMSGGASEYVMGYLTNVYGTSTWGGFTSPNGNFGNDSGFDAEPAKRYFDAYTTDQMITACSGGICYGHALSETAGWYNDDSASFVYKSSPWLRRGGNIIQTGGVFYIGRLGGNTNGSTGFRSAIINPGA